METKYIITIIYIIGFILTWIVCKKLRNVDNKNRWSDVLLTFLFSMFSFVGLFIIAIISIVWAIINIDDIMNIKPPKFL